MLIFASLFNFLLFSTARQIYCKMLSSLFFHRLKFLANQIRASCKSRLIIINDGMKQPLKCSKFVQLFAWSINSLWALVTPILAISVWEETDGSEDWSTLGKYGDIFNMESDNSNTEKYCVTSGHPSKSKLTFIKTSKNSASFVHHAV